MKKKIEDENKKKTKWKTNEKKFEEASKCNLKAKREDKWIKLKTQHTHTNS